VVGLTQGSFANDLNPGERHCAEILRDAGYDTHLFCVQHEARSPERCGYTTDHGRGICTDVMDRFVEFIGQRTRTDQPFFAQIGFIEPHRPFTFENVSPLPPDEITVPPYLPDIPELREDLVDLEATVAYLDGAFGRILDAIHSSAVAEETMIVFTADHGIPFPRAKMTLYDPGIEVPLIMTVPGVPGGVTHPQLIPNVDVLPTLLDLLDLPHPPNLQGRSFAALIHGGDYEPNERIFAEKTYHIYYDPMRAIRTTRWKLIANFECTPWQECALDYFNNDKCVVEVAKALNLPDDRTLHPPFELFDLENDSYEQEDLADDPQHEATRDDLIRSLRQWMQDTADPLLDGPMAQGAYRRRMEDFKKISL
jgi:arylsulfatase A-like enzyme